MLPLREIVWSARVLICQTAIYSVHLLAFCDLTRYFLRQMGALVLIAKKHWGKILLVALIGWLFYSSPSDSSPATPLLSEAMRHAKRAGAHLYFGDKRSLRESSVPALDSLVNSLHYGPGTVEWVLSARDYHHPIPDVGRESSSLSTRVLAFQKFDIIYAFVVGIFVNDELAKFPTRGPFVYGVALAYLSKSIEDDDTVAKTKRKFFNMPIMNWGNNLGKSREWKIIAFHCEFNEYDLYEWYRNPEAGGEYFGSTGEVSSESIMNFVNSLPLELKKSAYKRNIMLAAAVDFMRQTTISRQKRESILRDIADSVFLDSL